MAVYVNSTKMILLGAAWTGTAPGTPGTQTVSGTITTPSDVSTFARTVSPGGSVNMLDGTTFGSGSFVVNYPGLKSGNDLVLDLLADYAASQSWAIINTTLGGLAASSTALVYVDIKPTNSARLATNPSYVAAGFIMGLDPAGGEVGSLGGIHVVIKVTGKFDYLTS